ncbi:MAG TPA: class I SAM-dependent methyltransferase [Caldithrix abyssi]|uniref:Class I SAM-dependent methyltransferase n=1 Tax=Caldithrix abyssi TaxID=187145 RepID=A0A7V4WVJ1_CALAY|nr:class I SAM-dependent methyltransferase [Caldithrix abyssi]
MESAKVFFEKIAKDWSKNHHEKSNQKLRKIFDQRIPELQAPVLDAGSGTGVLIPFLYDKIKNEKCIVEYDIAFNMLMRAKVQHISYREVYYAEGDGHDIGFKERSFGTIFCFRFIPHLEDKKKALKEFYRILVPGGRFFILHFMDHKGLNHLHRGAEPPIHSHKMPPAAELTQIIELAGFDVEDYEEKEDLYFVQAIKRR